MAYTERYVTSAAGGAGDGSSGSPWTLAQAFANAVAGDRVNIQSDGAYSIGATTIAAAGTLTQMIIFRGYDATIGDLDSLGRNANGTLNTTGYPAITLTGLLQFQTTAHTALMNLNFTGALSSALIGTNAQDAVTMYQCSVLNTQNNASAAAIVLDDGCTFVMCDFECSGAAHGAVVDADYVTRVLFCRFEAATTSALLQIRNGELIGNLFIGAGGHAVLFPDEVTRFTAVGNTIVGCNRAFSFFNSVWPAIAGSPNGVPLLVNNHVTDNTEFIHFAYSGTADSLCLEFFNRTRDNTTARTGVGDALVVGEVTTDTGGASTDYADAGSDDYRLISGAPGEDAGLAVG
jgi:hypothetical protein